MIFGVIVGKKPFERVVYNKRDGKITLYTTCGGGKLIFLASGSVPKSSKISTHHLLVKS
jgi:hypothetical protein